MGLNRMQQFADVILGGIGKSGLDDQFAKALFSTAGIHCSVDPVDQYVGYSNRHCIWSFSTSLRASGGLP